MSEMNKSTLLILIQTEHHHFKSLLAKLNEAEMTRPGVIDVWSVKDILIHIIVHEQRMVSWVIKKLHEADLNMPQPYKMPEDDLTKENEQIYLGNRDRSLNVVLTELDEAYAQAIALVQNVLEADLIDPKRYQLETGEALWQAVAANTYEHYQEHARNIQFWQQKEGNQF